MTQGPKSNKTEKKMRELEKKIQKLTTDLDKANKKLKREIEKHKKDHELFENEKDQWQSRLKQVNKDLKASEDKYKTLFDDSRDAIYITSKSGRFIDVNPFMVELFGFTREEMIKLKAREIYLNPKDRIQFQEEIEKNGSVRDYEVELKKKDQTSMSCLLNATLRKNIKGKILGYQGIIRDVTHQKQLESQLQQALKMEAIGSLAGGIAHDFNNILTPILGFTEMAIQDVPNNSVLRKNLNEVLKSTYRAKDLIHQILTFSRQDKKERKPIHIMPIVQEAIKLLRSTLPSTIKIEQNLTNGCGNILADPTQIHQIVINLCTNAYHAMRENGGILRVGLKNIHIQSEDQNKYPGLSQGLYNNLWVSDTGVGMNQALLERIFEPYFTTKKKGEGTGMGLTMVHGIVVNHNGKILVNSEPGQGTTFNIYLPQILSEKDTSLTSNKEILPHGDERILFVDDEDLIVVIGKQMLERLGYQVTTLTNSIEALEIFKSQPDHFDLVITDFTMPGMTGDILSQELMKIRPNIPIILCTGFSEKISKARAEELGIKGFMIKPVVMKNFAWAIRDVLE